MIVVLLAACKKDKKKPTPPDAPGKYLTKITNGANGENVVKEIDLDENGNITELREYYVDDQPDLRLYNFVKNAAGQITNISVITEKGESWLYTFSYDAAGDLTHKTLKYSDGRTTTTTYTYDAQHRVIKRYIEYYHGETETQTYTYSNSSMNPSTIEVGGKNIDLIFDDKPNPYKTINKILYYVQQGEFYDNNLIEEQTKLQGAAGLHSYTTYTYDYYSNGYPIVRKTANASSIVYKYHYK
jgi:YD repeat-containing protein